jgi:hypothetical protein
MDKKRVIFVCEHNSARSQMAEAFLKQISGDRFEIESAGLEPGKFILWTTRVVSYSLRLSTAVDSLKERGWVACDIFQADMPRECASSSISAISSATSVAVPSTP